MRSSKILVATMLMGIGLLLFVYKERFIIKDFYEEKTFDCADDGKLVPGKKLSDAAYTWWQYPLADLDGNVITVGFTTTRGVQALAEINRDTQQIIDVSVQSRCLYKTDDHLAPVSLKLSDGSRIVLSTGHGGAHIKPGEKTKYFWQFSETGRVRDFGPKREIPVPFVDGNYLQLFERPNGEVVFLTNDDGDASWWIGRGSAQAGRLAFLTELVKLGPSSLINAQLYARAVLIDDTLHMFVIAHPENPSNDIGLLNINLAQLEGGSRATAQAAVTHDRLPQVTNLPKQVSQRLLAVSDDARAVLVSRFPTGQPKQAINYLLRAPDATDGEANHKGKWREIATTVVGEVHTFGSGTYVQGGDFLSTHGGSVTFVQAIGSRLEKVHVDHNGHVTRKPIANSPSMIVRPIVTVGDKAEAAVLWQNVDRYENYRDYSISLDHVGDHR